MQTHFSPFLNLNNPNCISWGRGKLISFLSWCYLHWSQPAAVHLSSSLQLPPKSQIFLPMEIMAKAGPAFPSYFRALHKKLISNKKQVSVPWALSFSKKPAVLLLIWGQLLGPTCSQLFWLITVHNPLWNGITHLLLQSCREARSGWNNCQKKAAYSSVYCFSQKQSRHLPGVPAKQGISQLWFPGFMFFQRTH